MKVELSEVAVGNHVGEATDRYVQYEMNREANAVLHKQYDLTNTPLTNAINVAETLRKIDLNDRKKRSDNSEDCLGFVQASAIHHEFRAQLFSKESCKVCQYKNLIVCTLPQVCFDTCLVGKSCTMSFA